MPPKLQAQAMQPEKILLAGPPGSGKTHNIIDIAKKCVVAEEQSMTIIDTESHVAVLLAAADIVPDEVWWGDELVEEGGEGTGIVLRWVRDWEEERSAISDAMLAGKRGDWVAVDSISPPWADVQNWWINLVKGGQEFGDWFTETIATNRAGGKKDEGAGDMLKEWKPINAQWNEYVLKPLMRSRAHVIVTAHTKSINPEHDDHNVKALWGPFRMKADTQKQVAFLVRTVIGVERKHGAGGGWSAMVLKDQGRTVVGEVPRHDINSFSMDYLRGVAGWGVVK